MRFTTLAAACIAALASSSGVDAQALDQAYIGQVIAALTAANLTSLANAAQGVAGTPEGALLLSQLQGSNKTLLAPTNDAFDAVPESVSSNTTLLANILSLHILNASVPISQVAQGPAHTIVRSLYNNEQLNGNLTVPVVLYRTNETAPAAEGSNATAPGVVVQQVQGNVNTTANATAANFQIYVIDEVLSLPPTLGEAAGDLLPALAGVVASANLLEPLEAARGLTVFAPNDAALGGVADTLATLNQTQVQGILANHVINGTTVFSTQLGSGSFVSAGGQPFNFTTNSTGAYVTSGNATARIVASDYVIANGVVHVIDRVLVNAASSPGAASSAASSYAEQATQTTSQPTGGIVGGNPTSTMGTARPSGSGAATTPASAASKLDLGLGAMVGSLAAVLGGLAIGATML